MQFNGLIYLFFVSLASAAIVKRGAVDHVPACFTNCDNVQRSCMTSCGPVRRCQEKCQETYGDCTTSCGSDGLPH
ncbi:hypothetical protein E4U43_002142 [Claviceps pusilla]|uniref:Uncharacterized protein n=1 Tax=Claviceps pusilla TaxID=123648 RepID=A0A9P7N923_9HYPO|nr:hypothetical protein E4U43_002142 [Claviceps pusilla]